MRDVAAAQSPPAHLVGIGVIVIVFFAWVVASYNSLVVKNQAVTAQWAQVENQYQRKIDLIPALVSTVSQYQQFERSTLENITRLRSQWQNATGVDQRINTSTSLDQNIFLIRVTYEAYPDLHSVTVVAGLMDELAGTENRIPVERARYNDAVRVLDTAVISFPNSLLSGSFGFHARRYYDPFPGGPP
ncbi:MAG: LemA family protein [Thermoplasmata archaeon]|nr:LemA family protein [Thermoplasmata archaeon]